jgi:hypothetical protein
MSSDDRDGGSGVGRDRWEYSSNRKRSGSRVRGAAILLALLGTGIVGFALLNLYVPETTNPVHIETDPLLSLGTIGTAGGVLVLFSVLVYVFAHRAGV